MKPLPKKYRMCILKLKARKSDENKAVDAVETTSVNEEMMIRSTILPNWVNMTRHWI